MLPRDDAPRAPAGRLDKQRHGGRGTAPEARSPPLFEDGHTAPPARYSSAASRGNSFRHGHGRKRDDVPRVGFQDGGASGRHERLGHPGVVPCSKDHRRRTRKQRDRVSTPSRRGVRRADDRGGGGSECARSIGVGEPRRGTEGRASPGSASKILRTTTSSREKNRNEEGCSRGTSSLAR